jgi:hypothetical protein
VPITQGWMSRHCFGPSDVISQLFKLLGLASGCKVIIRSGIVRPGIIRSGIVQLGIVRSEIVQCADRPPPHPQPNDNRVHTD